MSTHALRCSTCHRECVYDRCAPFGQEQQGIYTVAWRCPEGHGLSLDVCPFGPLVPAPGLCLNCGAPYAADAEDAACGACGLLRRACPAALGLADTLPGDPIASAREAFAKGLLRQGIAILNQAVQKNIGLLEAWYLKARFLNSLGFSRLAAEMLNEVRENSGTAADRIWLLQEQAFHWAECERGEDALKSADEALALGSNSVRTQYLRGRALALLGRLEEARKQMILVLTLDPDNSDAKRALGMIDAAGHPSEGKRWWQFWKR